MGVIMLLVLIGILTVLPFFFHLMVYRNENEDVEFEKEIADLKMLPADSLEDNFQDIKNKNGITYYPGSNKQFRNNQPFEENGPSENFYFDPNTASTSDWIRLGIRTKTVTTIQKYLSKGGHFYHAEDLKKIWSLHENEIKRLLPYVRLKEFKHDYPENLAGKPGVKTPYSSRPATAPVDINTGDTTSFIALPGIGSKLAARIIKFRERLGGFCSVEQVGETFGLPDSTFNKIRSHLIVSDVGIKKININTATIDELKLHPYIRYAIGNAICQYRAQHGNFQNVSDIRQVMVITTDLYKKLVPYLTAGNDQ